MPAADPRALAVDRVLRDGGSVHVRAIRPDDKERLLDHFGRLSARSVYFRFLGVKKRLTADDLRRLTELDFEHRVGLVATVERDGRETIIGVGRYARLEVPPGEPPRAEVAFAIADDHHGRGVATVLLEHLTEIARADDIEEFEADVLGDNNQMLAVFASSGHQVRRSLSDRVFHVSFPTGKTRQSLVAEFERDRVAAAASVRLFLEPRAVAVVGASTRPGSIGGALIENLVRCGFRGAIHPVHPHGTEVAGRRAYASVSAIGQPVDLAVIAVPADELGATVADCAHAGVRGLVVISGGFAGSDGDGRASQERLTALVRGAGMRMLGPDSLGVLNTDPAVALNATLSPSSFPAAGPVALLSRSGALGLTIRERFDHLGIGLASFVSVGNEADISSADVLAYAGDDLRTGVVVLQLEGFGNPRKLARVASAVARRVPIVAIEAGASSEETRAASSQSAARATLGVAVGALFEQAGMICSETVGELCDVTALLASQPAPLGTAVGVVTNAPALGVLLAAACEANGLALPALGDATGAGLRAILPSQGALGNPVDTDVAATPDQYARAIELVGADPAIDAVVAIHVAPTASEPAAAAIARGAGGVLATKPVLVLLPDAAQVPAALYGGPRGRLPVYALPENAARALAAAARYACWQRRPAGNELELGHFAEHLVRAVVDRLLERATGPVWIPRAELAAIMRAVGIECAGDDPVAGGNAGAIEALVGVATDPSFGPLVVCGPGGAAAASLGHVAYRLPPVTDVDAAEMVDCVRLGGLLDGYQGAPAGDRAALIDVICRVSALVELLPELRALALDPVKVLEPGQGVVVMDGRMQLAPS